MAPVAVLCHGFPPTERVGITQYGGTGDSSADFISANGILLGRPTALEKSRVITETGETMTLISPTVVPLWSSAARAECVAEAGLQITFVQLHRICSVWT